MSAKSLTELRAALAAVDIYVAGDESRLLASCPVPGCYGTITASENGNGLAADCTDGCDLREILAGVGLERPYKPTGDQPPGAWLEGEPCDPFAEPPEPLPILPGVMFTYRPASVLISAPTGSGKSCLLQAALYDAVMSEPYAMRGAYLSGEVGQGEFNARVRNLAEGRGDDLEDDTLLDRLARSLRWLDLQPVIERAWRDPELWADDVARLYNVLAIDPVSSVASALALDFDKSNQEYVEYHDRLVKPLIDRGLVVLQVDNIGHALEAKGRAKGVSAKQDKADIVLSCSLRTGPALSVKAVKVRSIRSPFRRGDEWTFDRATQRITAGTSSENGPGEAFRPTGIMEKVSRTLEADPGLTGNGVRGAVRSRAKFVDLALSILIAEGFVTVKPEGQAKLHYSEKPYRVPASEPRPDHVPDAVAGNTSRVSHPEGDAGRGTRSPDTPQPRPDQERAERLLADHADLTEPA